MIFSLNPSGSKIIDNGIDLTLYKKAIHDSSLFRIYSSVRRKFTELGKVADSTPSDGSVETYPRDSEELRGPALVESRPR